MRIAILGPLEVWTAEGDLVEVAGFRLRTLLVRLALAVGRTVSTSQLIDALWGSDPPAGATNALQALVSRLRRAVPDLVVESHPTGYRLALDPAEVDASRFEQLLRTARDSNVDLEHRREALRLWRGQALEEFAEADFARGPIARLEELRLSAVEAAAAAELGAGNGAALLTTFSAQIA